ncbi:MAG: MbcA/ParS/Xre antitoxin family protein [Hyphomicrobiaceae bacterium]
MPVTSLKLPKSTVKKASADSIAAGLRAFFEISKKWGLSQEQARVLLGQPSKQTFYNWRNGNIGRINNAFDLATRLSHVLGIFRALEVLYKHPELADGWVARPNLAFGGRSALEHMMGGQITDLAAVRDYLDSVRGGW